MDTKKLGAALLTGVLAASMLAGCGSDKKDTANDAKKAASRRHQCDVRSF